MSIFIGKPLVVEFTSLVSLSKFESAPLKYSSSFSLSFLYGGQVVRELVPRWEFNFLCQYAMFIYLKTFILLLSMPDRHEHEMLD